MCSCIWLKVLSHKYIHAIQTGPNSFVQVWQGHLGQIDRPIRCHPHVYQEMYMVLLCFAIALFYTNPKSFASESGSNKSKPLQLSWSMVCHKCKKTCRVVKSNRPTTNVFLGMSQLVNLIIDVAYLRCQATQFQSRHTCQMATCSIVATI